MEKRILMAAVSVLFVLLIVACFGNSARARSYANSGSKEALNGNYEKAIENYDKAIELDPSIAEIHFFRGNVYASMGDFEKAIEDCTEAIRLNPELPGAYSIRGTSYIKLGKDVEAIADLEKAIQLNPNDASVKQNLEAARFLLDSKTPFYSITLPENWAITDNHKYLAELREGLGLNAAEGVYTEKAYSDLRNDNNFLFISEILVPRGTTMEQLMGGSSAIKTDYNGREFYVSSETFNRSSTVKIAYTVYRNTLYSFFFVLENANLKVADQVLSSIQFIDIKTDENIKTEERSTLADVKAEEENVKKDGFFLGIWHGIRAPFVFILNIFRTNKMVLFSKSRTIGYIFGFILGFLLILPVFSGIFGGSRRSN